MSCAEAMSKWITVHQPRGHQMKNAPTFYRNLEDALDVRREGHYMMTSVPCAWKLGGAYDFSSNDSLSLSQTGEIRRAFLEELDRNPDFLMHSGGSRVCDGNSSYIEEVEAEIAMFHGAEMGLILGSGYEANVAIFTAIPRPGDAIVYDEHVHASALDGMAKSLAQCRVSFRHNDVEAFREAIMGILDSQPQIANGSRSILIAVESLYSVEGDICPLVDLLDVAKDMCPLGNAEFIIDEAHATGNLGPKGAGLVSQLGLEKQIAVRLHTFGKALASSGAVILGNASYQDKVQHVLKHFYKAIESNPHCSKAIEQGVFTMTGYEDWRDREYHVHMVLVKSRYRCSWLFFHLLMSGISSFPIEYPLVPRGQDRVRLMFHAANTEEQVEFLVKNIGDWADEMLAIEASPNGGKGKLPKVAQAVYTGQLSSLQS
ncbi:hypothetical protein E4U55_002639 [Claviceps digitariae]|nr:hypothetical protein E4U55_002639 [Claviceps digitariae]